MANKQLAAESLDVARRHITLRIEVQGGWSVEALGLVSRTTKEITFACSTRLHSFLKAFQHVTFAPYVFASEDVQVALDQIKVFLYGICNIYVVPGRKLSLEFDNFLWHGTELANLLDILKDYSGKSTKVSIRAFDIDDDVLDDVQRFC